MAVSDLINLSGLLDDAKCLAFVRQRRWPDGVRCPVCDSDAVIRDGCDDTQPCRQRCRCKACTGRFDDLTGTVLAGHHQPLRVWVLCLYLMGLNLSNRQIALELGLDASDTQAMTEQLRRGLVAKAPAVTLTGKPIIVAAVTPGTPIHTDEYSIYARLPAWGYRHKTVCHGCGEYARDEDGDGFCEVHVNTMEGFWSLLRSWLRPHRGISQEAAALSRLLPVRAQRTPTRQSPA